MQNDEAPRSQETSSGRSFSWRGLAIGLALVVATRSFAFLGVGIALAVSMGVFDTKDRSV